MASKITITFPDGTKKEYKKGVTGEEIAKGISEGLFRKAVAVKINDEQRDLYLPINESCEFKVLTFNDEEGKDVFWHSTSHLMAQAILRVFPESKLTIGPVVENGFYYDIDHPPFHEEDLEKIEAEMKKIVKENHLVRRKEISVAEAKKLFKNNKYKVEMLKEIDKFQDEGSTGKKGVVSVYEQGEFIDLCRGPHLPRTEMIKAFKLTKIAGAYWRGDAKNKQLQRIYGVSFPDNKQLKEYLEMLEEAEKRNHKKIGEEMGLFAHFDLVGKGLPVWLPRGEIIRGEVESFAVETEREAGYQRVSTPHLAKKELFEKSGHLPYYEDSMYPPMKMDDGTYYLKAMNCPSHHLIFSFRPRSYREMPVRLSEYGTCYRNELSGTLNGLLRVRILRMNDAHIYCTKDQIEREVELVLKMIKQYFEVFGLKNYWLRLSLHDPSSKSKYIDEPDNWLYAEKILRKVLVKLKLEFVEKKDEAAFYGPKIDVQFKNVYGREETMSTVQLDFAAKSRFDLYYVDDSGQKNKDVFVIHRAPLSTHERFMAFLIEHYAGKFPLWLSPVQVKVLTIVDRHEVYADRVVETLRNKGLRVEKDYRSETMNKKIRDAQLEKVNYIVVVGDREAEKVTVNIRTRDGVIHGEKHLDKFVDELVGEVKQKK